MDSKWALEFAPPLPLRGEGKAQEGDPASYDRIFNAYYRHFSDAGCQVEIVYDSGLPSVADAVALWPVLVLPAAYVAGDEQLQWYADYAGAGGHLVLGYHPGYVDLEARPRPQLAPAGPLRQAAGVSFAEFANIAGQVAIRSDVLLTVGESAEALGWADGFRLEGAEALAWYDHPHLSRWPAVTSHAHGDGRVTCVGTLPDATLGNALARWLTEDQLVSGAWQPVPPSVTLSSARRHEERIWFCANWAWEPATLTAPVAIEDLRSGVALAAGSPLLLGPWETRVLVERIPTHSVRPVKEENP
jgi:beta-galactosidase